MDIRLTNAAWSIGLLMALQACNANRSDSPTGETQREIYFTSSIDDRAASRASNNHWDEGDRIGVFMLKTDDKQVEAADVPYLTSKGDGYFTPAGTPLTYPEDGSKVDLIAYYPYDETATDYQQYTVDVTNQSKQEAIDFMVSNNLTGRDFSLGTSNLQFRHLLSKVVVNIVPDGEGSINSIQAVAKALHTQATVNLSDGTLTAGKEQKDITMLATKSNDGSAVAEGIFIPQTLDGKLTLALQINGKQKTVETDIAELATGNKYTFTINVKNIGGSTVIDPEASGYAKWTETPVIRQSQMEAGLKYINHYDPEDKSIRNYSLLFDTNLKIAYWVAYPLCNYYTEKNTSRTDLWQYDPSISKDLQFSYIYTNGGSHESSGLKESSKYDRGHQIPSADRLRSVDMNGSTFYFTNLVPQVKSFNEGIWGDLENKVRAWSTGIDTLFVVTGSMPTTQTDKTITYTMHKDGKQKVAVPKYMFKALARKIGGKFYTIAFKMDNTTYSNNDYMKYAISVSQLEQETGFTFFPQLDEAAKAEMDTEKWK